MNIYNSQIAIISDLHFGIHSNSDAWHKIILDYGKWLKKELDKKNIKDILILGDIFNDREEIGVKTLYITQQFFNIFNTPNEVYNIILLTGNHDSYFKDTSDINSVSIFKGWNNITVIDENQQSILFKNRKLSFCPWGAKLEDIPDNTDILFGHFEINTFKKNISKLCDDGIDSDTLLKKATWIISGHFHLRDERQYANNQKIIYVGCPYAQSWNDCGATKGYYIFDLEKMSYTFTENTISPTYYKIPLSNLFIPDKLADIKKIIPNNFIKILVDKEFDYTKLEKVMNTLSLLKPLELSSDFVQEELKVSENYESVHLDTEKLIEEFVNNLDITAIKDKVLKEIEEIYNKAITKVNIESD
jgi:DNA repair exonuclease SbcCD nuclease subunit